MTEYTPVAQHMDVGVKSCRTSLLVVKAVRQVPLGHSRARFWQGACMGFKHVDSLSLKARLVVKAVRQVPFSARFWQGA